MNFLKNKVIVRFVIFFIFIITMMIFWLIPGRNIIFGLGEGESGTPPGSEQPVTTDTTTTTDTAPETTQPTDVAGNVNVAVTETLSAAKVTAHADLTTAFGTYTEGNYTPGNWTVLTGFKTDGDAAIDAARI